MRERLAALWSQAMHGLLRRYSKQFYCIICRLQDGIDIEDDLIDKSNQDQMVQDLFTETYCTQSWTIWVNVFFKPTSNN